MISSMIIGHVSVDRTYSAGDESEIQDLLPISPPQFFNRETGTLTTRDEAQLSPRQRKLLARQRVPSPLVEERKVSRDTEETGGKPERVEAKSALPGGYSMT